MSTMSMRTKLYVYCEGKSEANYMEGLKKNRNINKNYVLTCLVETNHLDHAISCSKGRKQKESLPGMSVKSLFLYDSDVYRDGRKKIGEEINKVKEYVYFSNRDFEDFLKCHKTEKPYGNNKKPRLSIEFLKELERLSLEDVRSFKKPSQFEGFKTIYDLLIELLEKEI